MSKDIEEFLRLAAERRRKAQERNNQANRPREQPAPRQQTPRQQPARRQPEPDIIIEAEAVREPEPATLVPKVKSTIDTSRVTNRSSHLGENVKQESAKAQQHISDVFDHKVGRLAQKKIESPPRKSTPHRGAASPRNLKQILSTADGARQAILLAEILRRPEERWDS